MAGRVGNGGRLIAPVDRVLDPLRIPQPRGFMRSDSDTGRVRSRIMPTFDATIGDFGPLLYYHGADLYSDGGVITWPNRTSVDATLRHAGAVAPTIATFASDGRPCVRFADNADSRMLSRDLSGTLGQITKTNKLNTIECVFVMELDATPSTDVCFFSTFNGAPSGRAVEGLMWNILGTAYRRCPSVSRWTSIGGTDVYAGAAMPIGARRIVHLVARQSSADVFVNGVRQSSAIAVGADNLDLALSQVLLGGEAGNYNSAPVRIAEFAMYTRELTLEERYRIFAGYNGGRLTPYLTDCLDFTASSIVWHPERTQDIRAGLVWTTDNHASVSAFKGSMNTTRYRRSLSAPSTQEYNYTGTPLSFAAADPFTAVSCFALTSNAAAIRGAYAPSSQTNIGTDAALAPRAGLQASVITLGGLGSVFTKPTVGIMRHDGGTNFRFDAATWAIGGGSYTSASGSAVQASTSMTIDPTLASYPGGGSPFVGICAFAAVIKRELTNVETTALIHYAFQEYN